MGFFNKEVELIIPPKKQTVKNDKSVARGSCAPLKSLNGYDAIREKIDEGARDSCASPLTTKTPVEPTKPKTKVSIGL